MTALQSIMRMFVCAVFVICMSVPAAGQVSKTQRGESFAVPTFREVAVSTMMLGAFDLSRNEVIDEYAKLMYCSLYKDKFKLDFEWNNIRREISGKIKGKREYFRTNYEMYGVVYLGRYSFETQDFPLVRDTALVNVGSLNLLTLDGSEGKLERRLCMDMEPTNVFPADYVFLLQQPLVLDRIKMPMDEAEALLKRMDGMNNKERALYIRFRVRLLSASEIGSRKVPSMAVRGELISVDLFYDREMTKHFANVALK